MAVFAELVTALAIPLNKTNVVDFLHELDKHDLLNLIVRKKPCPNLLPEYITLSHSEYNEILTDTYINTGLLYIKDYSLFPECKSISDSFNKNYIDINKVSNHTVIPDKEVNLISTKLDSLGIYQATIDWSWYTFMDYVRI